MKQIFSLIVFFMLVILLAVIPNPISGVAVNYFLHFIEFSVISYVLLLIAKSQNRKNSFFMAVATAIIISVVLEIIQVFIPFRTFNPLDILAGAMGSFVILILKVKHKK